MPGKLKGDNGGVIFTTFLRRDSILSTAKCFYVKAARQMSGPYACLDNMTRRAYDKIME
jgi:hypothetical protein